MSLVLAQLLAFPDTSMTHPVERESEEEQGWVAQSASQKTLGRASLVRPAGERAGSSKPTYHIQTGDRGRPKGAPAWALDPGATERPPLTPAAISLWTPMTFPPPCAPRPSLELTPAAGAHCHSSCYWAMDSCCQDMDLVLITVSANTVNLLLWERVFENVHSGYNFSAAPAVCAQLIPDMVLWNSNHCIYKKARTHKYVTSGIYNAIFHHSLF